MPGAGGCDLSNSAGVPGATRHCDSCGPGEGGRAAGADTDPGLEPGLRPDGLCAGEFVVPQDFDAPLPEAELRLFES